MPRRQRLVATLRWSGVPVVASRGGKFANASAERNTVSAGRPPGHHDGKADEHDKRGHRREDCPPPPVPGDQRGQPMPLQRGVAGQRIYRCWQFGSRALLCRSADQRPGARCRSRCSDPSTAGSAVRDRCRAVGMARAIAIRGVRRQAPAGEHAEPAAARRGGGGPVAGRLVTGISVRRGMPVLNCSLTGQGPASRPGRRWPGPSVVPTAP